MFLGPRICQHAFLGVVKLEYATLNGLTMNVVEHGVVMKKPRLNDSRMWKSSLQFALHVSFLCSYGHRFSLVCPDCSGFDKLRTDHRCIIMRYIYVHVFLYSVYKYDCKDMLTRMLSTELWTQREPTEQLVLRCFPKVPRQKYLTLRLRKTGSDFCNTCTYLGNISVPWQTSEHGITSA